MHVFQNEYAPSIVGSTNGRHWRSMFSRATLSKCTLAYEGFYKSRKAQSSSVVPSSVVMTPTVLYLIMHCAAAQQSAYACACGRAGLAAPFTSQPANLSQSKMISVTTFMCGRVHYPPAIRTSAQILSLGSLCHHQSFLAASHVASGLSRLLWHLCNKTFVRKNLYPGNGL